MLPTFVIGLREGLEASLIVGIVAAFLRQRGRSDLLRWIFVGVLSAIALCTAAGVALELFSRNLPQKQQEGLETIIGAVAVAMVTYMVVWMKRHSRDLKGQLDSAAGLALAAGSAMALVAMAFLAVLREGLETVVFLLAAFNERGSGGVAALGAVLGIATAVGLGYAIYRGGIRINLSRFFRFTGVVLVFVAGGLVVSALHTAHEAGWLTIGQQPTVNLSSIVQPGTVQASLLTGMLGFQPQPVLIEVVGWLLYVIPVGLYVAWPPGKAPSAATVRRVSLIGGATAGALAVLFAVLAPAAPTAPSTVQTSTGSVEVTDSTERAITLAITPADGTTRLFAMQRVGTTTVQGVDVETYRGQTPPQTARLTVTVNEAAARNGGRLPLGVRSADGSPLRGSDPVALTTRTSESATAWLAVDTDRVIDVRTASRTTTIGRFASGPVALGGTERTVRELPQAASTASAAAARHDASTADQRQTMLNLAVVLAVASLAMWATAGWLTVRRPRRPESAAPAPPAAVATPSKS